jgi:hypothetical protein
VFGASPAEEADAGAVIPAGDSVNLGDSLPVGQELRPLRARERQVLEVLLRGDFAGAGELRAQLASTTVFAQDPQTFLNLQVDRQNAAASPIANGPIPVRALVGQDRAVEGELLVWVEDGFLSALEFAWVTDEMPAALPRREQIRVISE